MPSTLRADQVGSLLRPARLLAARAAHARGELSDEALRNHEDTAILDALDRQRDVGLQIFTDGEFRRGSWITDMAEAVDGFAPHSRMMQWKGPSGGEEPSTSSVVAGPLRARRRLTEHESSFVLGHAPGRVKVTLPAPSNFFVASWRPGVTDSVYASRREMADAAARIIRSEEEALIAEGVAYVQLDAPFYSSFIDEGERTRLRATGLDPDAGLLEAIRVDAAAVEGLARDGLTLALHVCRGNSRSRWLAEGAYDAIAEPLFTTVRVDRLLLEYDAPRAGTFAPLRFVPSDVIAVLGLVTTKEPELESADDLRRRIDEATRFVGLEQLALSPQCGFASVAAGNLLTEADQWRKLALVVNTARAVWT
jgi:5-methyltetrahydropteroyltriglutamate--homocysteine methyltransferase